MTMVLEVFIIMEFQNHVVIVKYDNVVRICLTWGYKLGPM